MKRLTHSLLALIFASVATTGCSSSAVRDADDATRAADRPTTKTLSPAAAGRARVGGTSSVTSGAGFQACLTTAGFTQAPPGHGVAAQWRHPSGAVLAVSTDIDQMATIASQFSTAGAPAQILDGGVIVAGRGTPARDARACAKLR